MKLQRNLIPDNWVKPGLVVEILADEITVSPIHAAGLALRFPRLIKFRDDKNPDQITSLKELQKLSRCRKFRSTLLVCRLEIGQCEGSLFEGSWGLPLISKS